MNFLFTIPGVTSFLSVKINQDPLEKFFGCQRQRGRANENPSAAEFVKNTQSLKVIGSICKDTVKGNCRGSNKRKSTLMVSDENSLPLAAITLDIHGHINFFLTSLNYKITTGVTTLVFL